MTASGAACRLARSSSMHTLAAAAALLLWLQQLSLPVLAGTGTLSSRLAAEPDFRFSSFSHPLPPSAWLLPWHTSGHASGSCLQSPGLTLGLLMFASALACLVQLTAAFWHFVFLVSWFPFLSSARNNSHYSRARTGQRGGGNNVIYSAAAGSLPT